MLAFLSADMVNLLVVTASSQAERRYTRTEVAGSETSEVRKVSAFKFETGITSIMVSIVISSRF